MAKFAFKLQSLLNFKTQMEDNLKNKLGKAIQQLENEKHILKRIENEKDDNINLFNSKSTQRIAVKKLREYNIYISFLNGKILLQKENVNHAQKIVDKVRDELIKVVQEKKMLEKLKEKKYAAFLAELQKDEQKTNDETINFKHNTKNAGEKNG